MALRWSSSEEMLRTLTAEALVGHAPLGAHVRASIDGLDDAHVAVVGMRGEEHTNHLYRFDVVANISGAHEAELRAGALGRAIHVHLHRDSGDDRAIHGIVAHAELLAYRDGHFFYHLAIVPKLWLATKTTDTRVFTDVTVQDVVTEVLREHGVVHAWSLAKAYERREYVLQYEETDYAFIERLLAEVGIFFTFEHPPSVEALRERLAMGLPNAVGGELVGLAQRDFSEDALKAAGGRMLQGSTWMQVTGLQSVGELLVLGDTASCYGQIDGVPQLEYRRHRTAGAMEVAEHHVEHFSVRSAIEPSRATVREYNHERAQVRPPGTVLGTFREGYQGAIADAVSAAVEVGSDVAHQATSQLEGAAGMTGPLAQATGFPVGDPAAALGAANENRSHGVVTATHAVMAPEIALARSAVAIAGELGDQLLSSTPLADAAGGAASGVSGAIGGAEASLEVYEHHGEYEEPEASFELARTRLEQLRAEHIRCAGLSHCKPLSPGHRFELGGHELSYLNRSYALVEVTHELFSNEAGPTYQNHFVCIPDDVPARPHVPHKRFHQAVETGVVVGPEGQEIATEHLGKVKVQFHWDRIKKHAEHSSCWIRVMQPWAGPGYGFQFVPRIGMEVMVSFVGGDMNRPVVIGCLPNIANRPPHHLPEHKTRSGIRTRSSPGGEGHNEIMFDDHAGHEAFYLRAQHNMEQDVRHNYILRVGHDETIQVEGARQEEVSGAVTSRIRGSATREVGGELNQIVTGGARLRFDAERDTHVGGSEIQTVEGSRMVSIRGSEQLIVQRSADGDAALRNIVVDGSQRISAAADMRLSARGSLELLVGNSAILMTPDRIVLRSPEVLIDGTDSLQLQSGNAVLRLEGTLQASGDEITLATNGASLQLDDSAHLDGSKVRLNCGGASTISGEDGDEPGTRTARFQVEPPEGTEGPLTFVVATPSGEVIEQQGDANNQVELEGRPGESFTLLDVRAGDVSLGVDLPEGDG